jgi:hypothetical protein
VIKVIGFADINAKAEGIETRRGLPRSIPTAPLAVLVDNFYESKKTATRRQPNAVALSDWRPMASWWENWVSLSRAMVVT